VLMTRGNLNKNVFTTVSEKSVRSRCTTWCAINIKLQCWHRTYQIQYTSIQGFSGPGSDRCLCEPLVLQLLSVPLMEPIQQSQFHRHRSMCTSKQRQNITTMTPLIRVDIKWTIAHIYRNTIEILSDSDQICYLQQHQIAGTRLAAQ